MVNRATCDSAIPSPGYLSKKICEKPVSYGTIPFSLRKARMVSADSSDRSMGTK